MSPSPEIRLVKWYRNDGDLVAVDEPICEMETDMATADLPAPHAGVLRQLARVGERVDSSRLVARIEPVP